MTNFTLTNNNFQSNSRREPLELSRLPKLPPRTPFRLPDFDNTPEKSVVVASVCAGCNTRLDRDDSFQQSIQGCRKCIGIYTRIDAAIEETTKRKIKETLEKFAGGAR